MKKDKKKSKKKARQEAHKLRMREKRRLEAAQAAEKLSDAVSAPHQNLCIYVQNAKKVCASACSTCSRFRHPLHPCQRFLYAR